MTVWPGVWLPLACGLVGLHWPWPVRRPAVWTGVWAGLCFGLALVAGLAAANTGWPLALDGISPNLWVIAVWAVGFGWTLSRGDRDLAASFSRHCVTLGGLLAAATSQDLLALAVAVELVRWGTDPPGASDAGVAAAGRLPFWGMLLGVAGCVGVTGSLELATIAERLAGWYVPADPEMSLGRPPLVLVGSVTLWLIAAVAGPLLRAIAVRVETAAEPLGTQLAALVARQLAALLAVSQTIAAGWPGLERPVLTLLLVLSALAGGLGVWLVRDRDRLDRVLAGLSLAVFGGQLLWLTAWQNAVAMPTLSVAPEQVAGWTRLSWSHDLLAWSAIGAVTTGWLGRSAHPVYLDQLRGMGGMKPWTAAALLIPLASLLGGPMLAGSWLRLVAVTQVLELHLLGPEELWLPRPDVRWGVAYHGAVWMLVIGGVLAIARVTLLEPPLGVVIPRRDRWPSGVTLLAALAIFLTGCCPWLLTALVR
jgi:hypothetical protein